MSRMLENASEVLFVLGILFTIAGVVFRWIRRKKDPYKGRATATVSALAPGKPDRAGIEAGIHDYYYPVMTFYAASGKLVRERYRKGSNPPAFRVGEKVPVRYDMEKPERFTLNHPGKEEHVEYLLYLAGLFFVLAGGVCYLLFGLRILG